MSSTLRRIAVVGNLLSTYLSLSVFAAVVEKTWKRKGVKKKRNKSSEPLKIISREALFRVHH